MKESLLFLQALLAHVDRLRALMGPDWPAFKARLEQVTAELAQAATDEATLLWVDEIFDAGVNSPAANLVRALYNQAAEKARTIDSATRSLSFTDPTLSQTREVVVQPHEQTGAKGLGPAVDRADLFATSEALLLAVASFEAQATMETTPTETPSTPATERHISAWVSERPTESAEPLWLYETYTLNFKVGQPVQATLITTPGAVIPASDVPEDGLLTDWVVLSRSVELAPITRDTTVTTDTIDGATIWTAQFPLHIPRENDSATIQLQIIPRHSEEAGLEILIYAGQELYRQFSVRLTVTVEEAPHPPTANAATIQSDLLHTPIAHVNLMTTHEWTTPPGETSIAVLDQFAHVKGEDGAHALSPRIAPWPGVQARVAGPIKNVRASAEQFRARWERYLNDIDPDDLAQKLAQWTPEYAWASLRAFLDPGHSATWDEVSLSPELRDLAYDGHILYETFFPADTPLRNWLDPLTPGHRLDISWLATSSSNWIPHVPWGLMYLPDLPAPGQPIDPLGFVGLRFRLGYTAHEVQAASKALGRPEKAYSGHFLYWGGNPQDPTSIEAQWQRQQWATWHNQIFLPTAGGSGAKTELLRYLDSPDPPPMTVLYLFCQCSVGDGNNPALRFGSTTDVSDMVKRTELATRPFADRPLVFANACTTSSSDPYIANELEEGFFRRGCRAYLGTETKVPIQFASRFATIFFHFFYRKLGYFDHELPPKPMAAGEAVAQTRLFLWTHYRNIGGLFYTYVNQYELFMADDADVVALRY